MKLTAQQLKFLVESVVNEMMDPLVRDPAATFMVQQPILSNRIGDAVASEVKDVKSRGGLQAIQLGNNEDEVVESAVAELTTKVEKMLSDFLTGAVAAFLEEEAHLAVAHALNVAIGSLDED